MVTYLLVSEGLDVGRDVVDVGKIPSGGLIR